MALMMMARPGTRSSNTLMKTLFVPRTCLVEDKTHREGKMSSRLFESKEMHLVHSSVIVCVRFQRVHGYTTSSGKFNIRQKL